MKIRTKEIEIALLQHFSQMPYLLTCTYFSGYESDFIFINGNDHITDVEIKITLSDFKKEFKKKKIHTFFNSIAQNKIKHYYFAVPDYLYPKIKDLVPDWAGVIIVNKDDGYCNAITKKRPKTLTKYKATTSDLLKFGRTSNIRLYNKTMELFYMKQKKPAFMI